MSLILKCTVKDKGAITWPPQGEPTFEPEERQERIAWLRDRITEAAEDTRALLAPHAATTSRVHVQVTFRPDIMVDA